MADNFDPDEYLKEPTDQFDPDQYLSENKQESSIEDVLSQYKSMIPATTGVATGGALELARRGIEATSGLAENLAYKAIGGTSTAPGKDLLLDMAKNLGTYESTVTPSKIGRLVLEEKLLGTAGLGTNEGNLTRAEKLLSETSKPTNKILENIQTPISKENIFQQTKQNINYSQLDPADPFQKSLIENLEQRKLDLQGDQPALQAEKTKRSLQQQVDFGDPNKTAKEAINKAQSKATREAVENAILLERGPEALEEFKKLKAKSGSAYLAREMIESTAKSGMRSPSIISNVSGALGDILGKKLPGVAAAALDTASKIAKSPAAKAVPYLGGALSAGLAASEFKDLKEEGKTPLEAAGEVTANIINPVGTKNMEALAETLRKAKEQNLRTADRYSNKAIITDENVNSMNKAKIIANSDEKYKAFADLLSQFQDMTEDQQEKAMFGLNQQPAFRKMMDKNQDKVK